MKILYVAGRWDPRDHNQGSGTDYEFYSALLRKGADVEIVGPFKFGFSFPERFIRKIYSRFSKKNLSKYPISYFFKTGKSVNQAIMETDPDVIVTKYSAPIVFARIDRPLVYMCDSSVRWLSANWRTHSSLELFSMSLWEPYMIRKCDRIITFSKANADVFINNYKFPAEKITFFAIPASIPSEVIPKKINKKNLNPVRLLLVGRDYHRKGVDIAIEIANQLKETGIAVELRIVGLDANQAEGENTDTVKFMGLYNKTIHSELLEYIENYKWANFLVHPARFEAAGIVPSEAAAFGVPTLTNDVGGLGTTVKDGVSGVVLPKDSPAEQYVEQIIDFIAHPPRYHQLVESTRKRYDAELNWYTMDEVVYELVCDLIKENQSKEGS